MPELSLYWLRDNAFLPSFPRHLLCKSNKKKSLQKAADISFPQILLTIQGDKNKPYSFNQLYI